MVLQNIAINATLRTGNISERNTFAKKSGQSDFDILRGGCTGSANTSDTGEISGTTSAKSVKNVSDNSIKTKAGQKKAEKRNKDIGTVRTAGKSAPEKADNIKNDRTDRVSDEKTDKDNDAGNAENLAVQIMNMLEQIRNAIMKALDLTEDDLDRMMSDLGLDALDLLEPETVKQLVLYDCGAADSTVLLLNEQINDTYRNLTTIVEDIKADTDLTRDEIKNLLENYGVTLGNNSDLNDGEVIQTAAEDTADIEEIKQTKETKAETDKISGISENADSDNVKSVETTEDKEKQADTEKQDENSGLTDGFEAFLNKLDARFDKAVVEFSDNNVRLYSIKDIAREIVEQVRIMTKPGQTTMELKLYPEHLGKVSLTISSNEEGAVSARMVVENEAAKEAVEGQMFSLKETLTQQGIRVESIEVTVAGYSFEQNGGSDEHDNTQHKNEGGGRKITIEEAVAMSEEPVEKDTAGIPGLSGHNIDYTA